MFLVNKDGDCAAEVNQIELCVGYDKFTKDKAERIYEETKNGLHKIGAYIKAEELARGKAREYLEGKAICTIVVNAKENFGEYEEERGKIIFEKILSDLKNGERLFDMREFERQ